MKLLKTYNQLFENLKSDDKVGKEFWFEYHCLESPSSQDSEIWYHSHQKVKVLDIVELGNGKTKEERLEIGEPRIYKVKFNDDFICDIFEDELLNNKSEFCRPEPPKHK